MQKIWLQAVRYEISDVNGKFIVVHNLRILNRPTFKKFKEVYYTENFVSFFEWENIFHFPIHLFIVQKCFYNFLFTANFNRWLRTKRRSHRPRSSDENFQILTGKFQTDKL